MYIKYEVVDVKGEVFVTGKCQRVVDALKRGSPVIWAHNDEMVVFIGESLKVFSVIDGTSKSVFIENGDTVHEVLVPTWPVNAPLISIRLMDGDQFESHRTHFVETTYTLKRLDIGDRLFASYTAKPLPKGNKSMNKYVIDDSKSRYVDQSKVQQFAEAICAGKSIGDSTTGKPYVLNESMYLIETMIDVSNSYVVAAITDSDVCLRLCDGLIRGGNEYDVWVTGPYDGVVAKHIRDIIADHTYTDLIRLEWVTSDNEEKSVETQQPEDNAANIDQQSENTVMVNEPNSNNVITGSEIHPCRCCLCSLVGTRRRHNYSHCLVASWAKA